METTVQSDPTADRRHAAEAVLADLAVAVGSLRCAGSQRLVRLGISMTHFNVLTLLRHHEAMPMGRLADILDASMSNATGIIDRMEEHGFIERVRVPDDRRVVLVRPTPAGLRALSETESTKRDRMRAVLGHIPASERPIVLAAFRTLRRALSAEIETSPSHQHHFADQAS